MRDPDITGVGYAARFPRFGAPDMKVTAAELAAWRAWQARRSPEIAAVVAAGSHPYSLVTGLDAWILHAPGSHGIWTWILITGCSLADIPGVPPAKKRAPENTHEIAIHALENATATPPGIAGEPEPDPDDPRTWKRLTPPNLITQVAGLTDETANHLIALLVRSFVNGRSSPDSDFTRVNGQLIVGTAAHLAAGKHVPP